MSYLDQARRVFNAHFRDAVAGHPDATDGDIAAGVEQGLAAVLDAFDPADEIRAWATTALADLPPEGDRTVYATGQARALRELLAFLDARHPTVASSSPYVLDARGEKVPF